MCSSSWTSKWMCNYLALETKISITGERFMYFRLIQIIINQITRTSVFDLTVLGGNGVS